MLRRFWMLILFAGCVPVMVSATNLPPRLDKLEVKPVRKAEPGLMERVPLATTLETAQSTPPMQWTVDPLPFSIADKMNSYGISVWRKDDDPNRFIIKSDNIMIECRSLRAKFISFVTLSNPELVARLNQARALKSGDDQKSYGRSARELIQAAKDRRFYGTEQHVVCSIAASARTGFIVAPEFFIEADPFGGTAGNGPEIESEGYSGEKKSTIAMTHDPDWILGRYFSKGPLSALSTITPMRQYQLRRMGCFGLVNAGLAQAAFNTGPLDERSEEHRINHAIAQELDRLAEPENIYTDFYTLKQGAHGWKVKYKKSYMKGGYDWKESTYEWDGNVPSGYSRIDLFAEINNLPGGRTR